MDVAKMCNEDPDVKSATTATPATNPEPVASGAGRDDPVSLAQDPSPPDEVRFPTTTWAFAWF